jgi:hypothetical protein
LNDRDVKFVIIGGKPARLHETGHSTIDIDICPSVDDVNRSRLADALRELGARLRVENDPKGVPFDPHPAMLRQATMMTLISNFGPLDICFAPDGFADGYERLSKNALVISVGNVNVPVASLRDVVISKRAAGRPKDVVALPQLEAHLRDSDE